MWRRRKDIFTKDDPLSELINELMTKVFVEQPLALPGSANNNIGTIFTWYVGVDVLTNSQF